MMDKQYLTLIILLSLIILSLSTIPTIAQQIQITIPAVNITITALSANGMPLTKYAIVGLNCEGLNTSEVGHLSTVIPIPSTGSITCKVYAYSFGIYSSKNITLTTSKSGETIPITLVIPVTGYYVPGIGFIPISTLIAIAIAIIIVIVLIVIALIEYYNWRKTRLARLIKPPEQ